MEFRSPLAGVWACFVDPWVTVTGTWMEKSELAGLNPVSVFPYVKWCGADEYLNFNLRARNSVVWVKK